MVRASIDKAEAISDGDVKKNGNGSHSVQSQTRRGHEYSISGAMTAWGACDCPEGQKGTVCKHQVKQ